MHQLPFAELNFLSPMTKKKMEIFGWPPIEESLKSKVTELKEWKRPLMEAKGLSLTSLEDLHNLSNIIGSKQLIMTLNIERKRLENLGVEKQRD